MMSRSPLLLRAGAAMLILAMLGIVAGKQVFAHPARQVGPPVLSYNAKFVCGVQPVTTNANGEPPVKFGNYATEINIYNYHIRAGQNVSIIKQVLVLVQSDVAKREPAVTRLTGSATLTLPPLTGTMDDCNAILALAGLPPTTFTIGYLVIQTSIPVEVTAVYTSQIPPAAATGRPTTLDEQVVDVPGRSL